MLDRDAGPKGWSMNCKVGVDLDAPTLVDGYLSFACRVLAPVPTCFQERLSTTYRDK
jgi:hypothetical protein